ncbi:Serine/threonine-protein kinase MEC1 [Spathaspora sp. JA1]|nr:Serine/threonine-protein kinase MEC1 [Spathaspora sp. JA1]
MTPISLTELQQFLTDVETSIDQESSADFKKLTLYLFTFINQRIHEQDITNRLFNVLELVLSKKPHLLQLQLDYNDYHQIYTCQLEHPILYQWSILFALYHIGKLQLQQTTLRLKSFIIHIINLQCRDLKSVKSLRKMLLDLLNTKLTYCLTYADVDTELVISCHLYSIVNDFDICQTLLVNSANHQLKLASFARKLWYLLNDTSLKSILIVNHTDNLLCSQQVNWDQISMLLTWLMECVTDELANVVASSLLKVYGICLKAQIVASFNNYINLSQLLTRDDLPKVITKCLKVIDNQKVDQFKDPTLESVRVQIFHPNKYEMFNIEDVKFEPVQPTSYINQIKKLLSTNISEDTLHSLLSSISHFPCVVADNYNFNLQQCTKCETTGESPRQQFSPVISKFYQDVILKLFKHITTPLLHSNFLLVVFHLFSSYYPPQDEVLFNYLLEQLYNPHRQVRMLIPRILPLYLQDNNQKFEVIFSKLCAIDIVKHIHLGESTIRCFVELSISSKDGQLFTLLVKLISYLSNSSNPQHVNYVYNGIITISQAKKLPPEKLLAPIIPTIADQILISNNPQILIELLNINKRYFLSRYKEYLIPKLLEYYKVDYINQIANATNLSKWELISKNKSRIIGYYLTKQVDEKYIMNVLTNVVPKFKILTLNELMSKIGDITWYVLLNIEYQEEEITNRQQIESGLKYIAKVSLLQRGISQPPSIDYLFREYILELIQKFHENVHHIKGTKPYLEKKRSIQAIEYIINTSNITSVIPALGQISTCLQAILEDNSSQEFQYLALKCWFGLVDKLPNTHLISIIDIIISIIFQKFNQFNINGKQICRKILTKIYHEIKNSYKSYTLYYLSLPYQEYDFTIHFNAKQQLSKLDILFEFIRRLETRNEYVVKQALFDLNNYIEKYPDIVSESTTTAITTLIQTILDTSYTFKQMSHECARILGIIGSLDSNKFNFKQQQSTTQIILYDFNNHQENVNFLIDFIQNKIINMFWYSNDPNKQLFTAYSMQKFLTIMKLSNSDWSNRFTQITKSTLTPLLTSKYVAPRIKYIPIQFPYFKLGMKYETWLIDITLNLLHRGATTTDTDKMVIFQTFSMLIKDIPICQYLIKYIALSHVINQIATDDLIVEFLHILNLNISSTSDSEHIKSCCQTIFEILDYFGMFQSQLNNTIVNQFLELIPMDLIAIKSIQCDSYERTILYLEKCYRQSKQLPPQLNIVETLQSMYCEINDYDSLNGILSKFTTNNLQEKLQTFQYNDNWSLAHESFKVLENKTKVLKSLHDHGLYDDVLTTLTTPTSLDMPLEWALIGLSAAAYSGKFSDIQQWLTICDSIGTNLQDIDSIINYQTSKAINCLYKKNQPQFTQCINDIYSIVGKSLVPSTSSQFNRNITLMNQLHALYDLTLIVNHDDESKLQTRLININPDFDITYKILTLHNLGYKLTNPNKISKNLLYISQLARDNNRLDISTRTIIQAMKFDQNNEDNNIEYANLLWCQDKQAEAIKLLSEVITKGETTSQVQLQYANWLNESNHLSTQEIIQEYTRAINQDPLWETPYYELGKYYNKIMESTKDINNGYYQQQIIRYFIKSLSLGTKFVYEALPKLITIWLDFATTVVKRKSSNQTGTRKLNQIVEDIKLAITTIPNYTWYTAITQMLSRITHDNQSDQLSQIIKNIIMDYPRQSLWYVLSHTKSSDVLRKQRVNEILHRVNIEKSELSSIVDNSQDLFANLINLAQFKIPKTSIRKLSLSKDLKMSNLNNPYFGLVLPIGSNLEINLPKTSTSRFTAFPKANTVTFNGCDDLINIFHSLQMPKQISITGTDGKSYKLMVKCDDTRKDAKVVEFTTMVNRLLISSNEARKRNLQISNYCVIPLSETMGIIEFVNDVSTLKSIYQHTMKRMGKQQQFHERKLFMKIDEAQRLIKASKRTSKDNEPANKSNLIQVFSKILKDHPPILHNWFIENFPDPSSWYLSRNSFTRSTAVMSMVGYIIGLGDRHCENILLFRKTGAMLHIDFDCLFEKGKTLPCPELVPFRLTSNIVDSMGITGIEGSFRITSEVTGTLLRNHEPPLMNILQTLLYDPLLDWKNGTNPEIHLSRVRRKLRGLIGNDGLPMNIHGQVDVLIQEATSLETLAQMYAGWSAYI